MIGLEDDTAVMLMFDCLLSTESAIFSRSDRHCLASVLLRNDCYMYGYGFVWSEKFDSYMHPVDLYIFYIGCNISTENLI